MGVMSFEYQLDDVMDILDLATDTNAKRLYSYVKSQKKDSSSVGPLRGSDGQTYSSPGRKANILSDQFAPSSLLRTKMICRSWSPHHTKRCPGIDIHVNGVAKLLRDIKPPNSTGPDAIPARAFEGGSRPTGTNPDYHLQSISSTVHSPGGVEEGERCPHLKEGRSFRS